KGLTLFRHDAPERGRGYFRHHSCPRGNQWPVNPTGKAHALERIAALETELAAKRRQFAQETDTVQRAAGNIVEFLKITANKDDIEPVRESIIAASEGVRVNVADVILAVVRKIANGHDSKGTRGGDLWRLAK